MLKADIWDMGGSEKMKLGCGPTDSDLGADGIIDLVDRFIGILDHRLILVERSSDFLHSYSIFFRQKKN